MSSRRPLTAFVVALAAGAQVVAGLGAGPTWWQVIGGTAAVLLAGLGTWWSAPDFKKIANRLFNNPHQWVGAAGAATPTRWLRPAARPRWPW